MTVSYQDTLYFKEISAIPGTVTSIAASDYRNVAQLLCPTHKLPKGVVTIGRGSSAHAAWTLRDLFSGAFSSPSSLSVPVMHLEPGELPSMDLSDWACFAISQSGGGRDTSRLSDIVLSARAVQKCGATLVAITNDTASLLAQEARSQADDRSPRVIDMMVGTEEAVPATKTWAASVMIAAKIFAACEEFCQGSSTLGLSLAPLGTMLSSLDVKSYYAQGEHNAFMASPILMVSAPHFRSFVAEAALKFTEVLGLSVHGLTVSDAAHGPAHLLSAGARLVGFLPSTLLSSDLLALGKGYDDTLGDRLDAVFMESKFAVQDIRAAVVALGLAGVMIANHYTLGAAIPAGKNPDRPQGLHKVTLTGVVA